ncbi:CheR family methyltransferase [Dechloromonas agitata]|uniref:CheR family methyltransferase n=1 Tax=Dechloromonas agitata TaxID=73030 RepID=UPI0004891052|nr:protein-glutamate O-methyltransferase CheR [Dechloromonas agitata]
MHISSVGISDQEFARFRQLIYQLAGISLSDAKRTLVCGRLAKRLRHYGMSGFGEYLDLLSADRHGDETQTMVDLLTTNETYFFREEAHFDFLKRQILPRHSGSSSLEIWSAACSTGEEVYSLCMLLAEHRGLTSPWRVTGSDISTQVLATASSGQYPMSKTRGLPEQHLKNWCLKGVRAAAGSFRIAPALRERTRFMQVNLNAALPEVGTFDVIFLRNVMIYFDVDTKRKVVQRLLGKLRPGGYLIIGHSESLHGLVEDLRLVQPTIYQRPER